MVLKFVSNLRRKANERKNLAAEITRQQFVKKVMKNRDFNKMFKHNSTLKQKKKRRMTIAEVVEKNEKKESDKNLMEQVKEQLLESEKSKKEAMDRIRNAVETHNSRQDSTYSDYIDTIKQNLSGLVQE